MLFNTLQKLTNKAYITLLFWAFASVVVAQNESKKEIAQTNFELFIDSILQKEVAKTDYEIRNYSELQEKREFPLDLTSLAFPEFYADKDEYYAAFLYREKFHRDIDFVHVDKKTISTYSKLRKTIRKSIPKNRVGSKKEQKWLKKLQNSIQHTQPPLIGYIQFAEIEFVYLQKTTITQFEIHYNLRLEVENFGKR